jgi:TetR/AcrR family transcriptional regulator, transcriptional repressor for nem operon
MENRKTQIIDLAFKLIQEKGYVAISYDDLSRPLGVTKASIHYHFEKKEDLGAAVIDRMMQRLEQFLPRSASLSTEERLTKFIAERMKRFGLHDICPLSSLQSDYESLPEVLQRKVKELSEKELIILTSILEDMQEEGAIHSSVDTGSLALMILAGGKGILQYQRVLGQELFPEFMKQVHHLMK